MKNRKNNEKLWKIEKKQWNIVKNRETRMNNDEKREKKQWEIMKKIETNETWWNIEKKWKMMKNTDPTMKNDGKTLYFLYFS